MSSPTHDIFKDLDEFFKESPKKYDLPDNTPYIKVNDDEDLFSIFSTLDSIDEDALAEQVKNAPKQSRQKKPKRKICVIDAETDPFEHRLEDIAPFIWGFYDGDRYIEFYSTRLLIKFLRKRRYYVFAHNGGKFDFHFLLNYIDYGQRLLVINGRLSRFNIGESCFLDSYNLLPEPLSAMQKDEIEYWKMHRKHRHKYMEEIRSYLRSDCVYLYEYITEFIKLYGFNITMAGAAFKFWQNKLSIKNNRPRQSKHNFEFLRKFYYGGRVSPFRKGIYETNSENETIKVYDINSAYSHVMKNFQHPISTTFYRASKLPDNDDEIRKCFISLECISKEALPIRLKNNGIDFPYTEVPQKFDITGHEFVAGVNTNTITNIKIRDVYMFDEYVDFAEYIDIFFKLKYEAKKDGRKAHYLFAKKMQNALYGKYASDYSKYQEFVIDQYGSIPPEGFEADGMIGFNHQLYSKEIPEYEQKYINIGTSASITGAVRAYLWTNINKCRNVFYCDTDSIFCASADLNIGNELGEWELEAEGYKIAIGGKKLYAMWLTDPYIKDGKKHKIACKGVKLSAAEIERVCKGETVTYRSEAPTFNLTKGMSYISREVRMT